MLGVASVASALVLDSEARVSEDVKETEIVSSGDKSLVLRDVDTIDVRAIF